MKKQKYHIKRTGRRCTRYPFTESDGTKRVLNPVGAHVWSLTAEDAARVAAMPDTRVRMIRVTAVAAKPAKKVVEKTAAKEPAKKAKKKK